MGKLDLRFKMMLSAKIGIIKQLHKDKLITDKQYRFLMNKYDCKKTA